MNTKLLMTLCAITLGAAGISLTFIPDTILSQLNIEANKSALLLTQILGALYFAFGMLNWMTKTSLIGGIYNRPIAVANFTHFLIAGLALLKVIISNPNSSYIIWTAAAIYFVFGLCFGVLLFRHPISEAK
ncbi:MAG: hypothetical protein IPP15_00820 [Saprospiraceae bacterium]|uniref:Uncharacterized protein n=1 Tax=Candidatus Opimibacter skivensis TaxID=2982028 RepID=A0A9D7SS29_9BACT|nr:hypothetical protein [Candidatus Opimibacter skivensis]